MEQAYPAFQWSNPTRVVFGVGELSRLAPLLDDLAGSKARVFLVTGRRSLQARGILRRVIESLGDGRVHLFDQATPFPSPDLADRALAECRGAGADVVLAIGGGSAIDVGKAVAVLAAHQGTAREFAMRQKALVRPGLPFVAVPTTSGSSSEVTASAALWDMEARRSMALVSPLMFPKLAIVDPELAMSMPMALAAATGMDAFTSAFECFWSLEAGPVSDALALEVIRLFNAHLERSCIQADLESRTYCALAATMSGIAYSNSRPNACHAVGSPLTLFWGVAHGQAVGVTLASFLRWTAPAMPHKLPALWSALGVRDLDGAVARITQVMRRCGLETRLSGLGLTASDMDLLLEHIRWDRLEMLPRPLERADARQLLEGLL